MDGDRNTKLFHNMVKRKRAKGKILSIQTEGGLITEPAEIHASALAYFEKVLTEDFTISEDPNLSNFQAYVTSDINATICETPNLKELKEVVFSLNKEASAGPDGFTAQFYHTYWDFIKFDLLEAVEDFFPGSELPIGISSTSLALIPKSDSPTSWSDFRPISLCNFSHKIISKLLNDRLAISCLI